MTVGRSLCVNGPAQVEPLDDAPRGEVEHRPHRRLEQDFVHRGGALRVHQQAHRRAHANGVGQLQDAAPGQAGGDDVLGHVAGRVGRAPVHLGRILAGEGAAAMRTAAAVGVDDDLAAGEAGVAHGPADHEPAGGVDEHPRRLRAKMGGQHRPDDSLGHLPAQGVDVHGRVVLGGEHHRVHGLGTIAPVPHGHLALGVRPQPGQLAVPAQLRLALDQPVGEQDRQGHQFRGLVAGAAEHQPLVAGADLLAPLHALADVRGLVAEPQQDFAAVRVDAREVAAVAGVAQESADQLRGLVADAREHGRVHGVELAAEHHQIVGEKGFAGHPGRGFGREEPVEDGVRDAVGELVGMPGGDRLGGEQGDTLAGGAGHGAHSLTLCRGMAPGPPQSDQWANALAVLVSRPASCCLTRRRPDARTRKNPPQPVAEAGVITKENPSL